MALVLAAAGAPLAAERLVEGKRDSVVRVVIYEDLQCGDCARFRQMLDEHLLPRYGARVAFEHRDFPLAKHAWARHAAIAARFFEAVRPELGVAYRRHTLASIAVTTTGNFAALLGAFARSRGVDPAKAVAALDNPELAALVEKDFQDGVARGVAKTPTVFVNGQPFIETFTVEEISRAIDGELN